jgi:hypothetical protein
MAGKKKKKISGRHNNNKIRLMFLLAFFQICTGLRSNRGTTILFVDW